jgi:hypothetical protein
MQGNGVRNAPAGHWALLERLSSDIDTPVSEWQAQVVAKWPWAALTSGTILCAIALMA